MTAPVTGRRAPHVGVLILRMAIVAAFMSGALFFGFFFTGIGGFRGGWLWASVVAAGASGALAWEVWGPFPGQRAATAVLALLGVVFGLWISQVSTWSHGRLRAAMDSLVPAGFVKVGDTQSGNAICFDVCNQVEGRWWAPGATGDVEEAVRQVLVRKGFTLRAPDESSVKPDARSDALKVRFSVSDADDFDGTEPLAPPPGHVVVTLTLSN